MLNKGFSIISSIFAVGIVLVVGFVVFLLVFIQTKPDLPKIGSVNSEESAFSNENVKSDLSAEKVEENVVLNTSKVKQNPEEIIQDLATEVHEDIPIYEASQTLVLEAANELEKE